MKNIIFDTDIGGDADDTGALAIILNAQKKGEANLLAVMLSTINPYAAACADAINNYYNIKAPIGQTITTPPLEDTSHFEEYYGKHIAINFKNDYYGDKAKKPQEAVRLYRKILSENIGKKITVVVVGSNTNLAKLLESQADDISEDNGVTLISKAVEKIVMMGCYFTAKGVPEIWFGDYKMEAECNIKVDILAAQTVFKTCPVEIVVSHFLLGYYIHTGAKLIAQDRKNPVAEAYYVHSHGNRDSWDPITAYYAVYGENNIFKVTSSGKVSIDDNGVSSYIEIKNGNHKILSCANNEEGEKLIDNAICGKI